MGQGIGILVSKIPKETSASYSLREPSEVAPLPTATSNSAQTTYFGSVLLCSEKCERKPAEILHRKVTVGAGVVKKKKKKKELGTGHVRMAPKAQVLPCCFREKLDLDPLFSALQLCFS